MGKPPPSPLFVMKSGMSSVHCLRFHNHIGNELLYSGTQDGIVYVWDLKVNRPIKKLHHSSQTCLSIHTVMNSIITQDKECLVKIWQISESDFIMKEDEIKPDYHITFCKMDALTHFGGNNVLAIPQSNSSVKLYSLSDCKSLFSFDCPSNMKLGEVMCIKCFTWKGTGYILTAYEVGVLLLWDIRQNKTFASEVKLTEVKLTEQITPMCLDFSADTLIGYCGSNDSNICVFHLTDSLDLLKQQSIPITNAGIGCLKIRPDNKIFAAGGWDGKLRIFSHKTKKLLAILDCHDESILDLCYSDSLISSWNSKYLLASGGADKKISLWNIYND